MKPKRIRRSRSKGWKMPENTVYVGKGSKWGNPFKVGKDGTREYCVDLFNHLCCGRVCVTAGDHNQQLRVLEAIKNDLHELRGKNLACWCRDDGKHCHGDTLLMLANKPMKKRTKDKIVFKLTEKQLEIAARRLFEGRNLDPDIRGRLEVAKGIIDLRVQNLQHDDTWEAIEYAKKQK